MGAEWTLEELERRVAQALAASGVPSANARVTAVPDARVIRWYSTIGLVDRPAAMRGRTALYGERHLLQLVAIKRRQAQGRTLAEIQVELAGATLTALRRSAGIAADLPTVEPAPSAPPAPPASAVHSPARFWAAIPAPPSPASAAGMAEPDSVSVQVAVPLGHGAILVLPALAVPPTEADLAAIRAAAQAITYVLAARGLAGPAHSPTRSTP